ncbi:hypothetical protein BH11PSE3_BH11PSE3_09840 [soil metagenome]
MSEFALFGTPERFEIAVRWVRDAEPRARRPAGFGWSMGDFRITVANHVLTGSRRGSLRQEHVGWYLAPLFDWMASNWAALLHEEDFAWPERSAAPAVVACHRALDQSIGLKDSQGRARYKDAQAWYYRHALRSAAEGGLFPDLFIRRMMDDIEVSWSAEPPLFAPDGFRFSTEPGVARLPVEDVAGPLWQALSWAATEPLSLDERDRASWNFLAEKIERIPSLGTAVLDRSYVDARILELAKESLERIGSGELIREEVSPARPYVRELSPAVAMFGGVRPDLGAGDVGYLCQLLAVSARGGDSAALRDLVAASGNGSLGVPHEDGYAFAEDFLEGLGLPGEQEWIDVRKIALQLGIEVREKALETDSIRGVALAGEDFTPIILLNETSPFNVNEFGQRYTLAYELCHILYDRSRARRVTHVSGAWVASGVERRANAFAAYLLMPRALLVQGWRPHFATSRGGFQAFANRLQVNERALAEHLYNLGLIDDLVRERLRAVFRRH